MVIRLNIKLLGRLPEKNTVAMAALKNSGIAGSGYAAVFLETGVWQKVVSGLGLWHV